MGDLAADTAIDGRDGHYRASLARDWEIWGPNGGYLAAIALRAAGASTGLRRPASFACHYLSVAEFDEVELHVTTLRASKRAASLRVSMTQQARPILEAVVWVVGDVAGLEHDTAQMPPVPPPSELKAVEDLLSPEDRKASYPFWQNLEARPIDWVHWNQRAPGPPVWREWYRFRPRAVFDDPFVDAARALVLIDTMLWPATCRAYAGVLPYVAPNLDVAVQFHRAAAACEWLLCDAAAPVAAHGLIGGQSSVWSADGQLLASGGGQLLCRPRPAS
ncbi:MAG: thioesterase family protein [Deltaproteobacteria bacterium]|nr:thioesterase family protein [Deltaproteobacteria bacterium]